jgi:hypothetical protein
MSKTEYMSEKQLSITQYATSNLEERQKETARGTYLPMIFANFLDPRDLVSKK